MAPAVVTLTPTAFRGAVHITTAWIAVFVVAIVQQARTKFAAGAAAKKRGERFNRYTCEATLVADRTVANQLEWGPAFLALFWMASVATGGGTLALGWAYVGLRALYIVLAANGGLCAGGARPKILLATVPAYGVLTALMVRLLRAV
jgi:MAPEG family